MGNHVTGTLIAAVVAHAIGVSLYSFLLQRRNLEGEHAAGAIVLRYPRTWHWFAWTMLLAPLTGLAWLAWKFPPKPSDIVAFIGLLVGFGGMGAWFVIQVTGVAHELQPGGLLRVTPWAPRRFLPWSEIRELRYSDLMTAWRLRTAAGDSVWVFLALSGIGAFTRAALDNVPAQAIDRSPQTRRLLASQSQRTDAAWKTPKA
jgi:hypothetical protein